MCTGSKDCLYCSSSVCSHNSQSVPYPAGLLQVSGVEVRAYRPSTFPEDCVTWSKSPTLSELVKAHLRKAVG